MHTRNVSIIKAIKIALLVWFTAKCTVCTGYNKSVCMSVRKRVPIDDPILAKVGNFVDLVT